MDECDAEHTAITRLKQGDISGLALLVERYQVQAVRVAYLITHDHALAEDVAQEAFLQAYHHIDQFDLTRPFAPWFLRSVMHAAVKSARRQQRSLSLDTQRSGEVAFADLLATADPGPGEQAEHTLLQQAVWDALQRLSPPQRAAVVMRYYLGLSERDMSAQMDCPPGTIKWRLNAARRQLREWLRPFWPGITLVEEEV